MTRRWIWLSLKTAIRSLSRQPGFTLVGALTLALGIGANTAVFTILYGALLQPLPYPDSHRLVWLADAYERFPEGRSGMSTLNYVDMRAASRELASSSAYLYTTANLSRGERPERVRGMWVNASFLSTLGLVPRHGRDFQPEDDVLGAEPTVILTHGYWQEAFGGDEALVGNSVLVDQVPHTVVGIAPRDFSFPFSPRFLLPFRWDIAAQNRIGRGINVVARLAEDATIDTARAELEGLMANLVELYPEANEGWRIRVFSSREWIIGDDDRPLYVVAAAAALVLLIAIVNMANLLLVRSESRAREFAVRSALGAGRIRLLPEFLGEALTLALLGGTLALFACYGTFGAVLATFRSAIPRPDAIAFDFPAAAFTGGLSLLVGIGVGVIPWLRFDPAKSRSSLREGTRSFSDGPGRLQRTLIVGEVALALVVVVASGLLTRSFWNIMSVELGIADPEQILTFSVSLPEEDYPTGEARAAFYDTLEERIQAFPGVIDAGFTTVMPLRGGATVTRMWPVGKRERYAEFVDVRWITPGFLGALGLEVLRGRTIRPEDGVDAVPNVLINETLARELFGPEGDPLGSVLQFAPEEQYRVRVVGVMSDFRDRRPENPFPPGFYSPISPPLSPFTAVGVVRTERDPMALAGPVRQAIADVDPMIPISGLQLLSDVQRRLAGSHFSSMTLVGVFALLALGLGGVGVYGLMSYSVTQQSKELGIRLAIGSRRRDVFRLVAVEGTLLGGIGIATGIIIAVLGTERLSGLLFETDVHDPAIYIAVAIALGLTCLCAAAIPAWRATRVDPAVSIRAE